MDATNDGTRNSGRKILAHPYLARQMVDIGFWQNPYGSNSGVHVKIFPLTIHVPTPRCESKLQDDQHKGHKVYTGSAIVVV